MKRCMPFCLAALLLFAFALQAQEPERGPDGKTSTHVAGVILLAIPGKPFSAHTSTEWTRTLADGSTITTHLDASLARDSQGRIYRERRSFVPANSKERSRLNEVHIYDPVARKQMLCSTRAFQCIVGSYAPMTLFETRAPGPFADNTRFLTREKLGTDVIEGIYVTGTRETTTINAGVLGNDRPIVSTREFWYSDELQTNLVVIRDDPQEGKQVIRLSKISQAEPDSHMFEAPEGYAVRDDRMRTRTAR
jgi:hypothetical protein